MLHSLGSAVQKEFYIDYRCAESSLLQAQANKTILNEMVRELHETYILVGKMRLVRLVKWERPHPHGSVVFSSFI